MILYQKHICRADLRANPQTLYLFGDNETRSGLGGQAAECRGEPNAVGVATKRAPANYPSAFWRESEFQRCIEIIDADLKRAFDHAYGGGLIVCPLDGLGTGRAGLATAAPSILQYIRARLFVLSQIKA